MRWHTRFWVGLIGMIVCLILSLIFFIPPDPTDIVVQPIIWACFTGFTMLMKNGWGDD